jgi:hypothetical protein
VVGASAGAIFNPADNIPVKFDDLDPCHKSSYFYKIELLLFGKFLNG